VLKIVGSVYRDTEVGFGKMNMAIKEVCEGGGESV
jgi:hypothetical protein